MLQLVKYRMPDDVVRNLPLFGIDRMECKQGPTGVRDPYDKQNCKAPDVPQLELPLTKPLDGQDHRHYGQAENDPNGGRPYPKREDDDDRLKDGKCDVDQ